MILLRNTTIDFLRGFAIIIMVVIHVTNYYLSEKYTYFVWDYTHFVVPIFTFCSAFIYFKNKSDAPFNLAYLIKRGKRIVIPYYIFLIVYFLYVIIIQNQPVSLHEVYKSIFLIGDQNLSWLVLLFLYYILLFPFIRYLDKKPGFILAFTLLALFSSIILLFVNIPIHFRLIMWLPWSVILMFTYLFTKSKKENLFLVFSILISAAVYFFGKYLLASQDKSLVLVNNKYPPNIYYLSYGIFWLSVLYLIHNKILKSKIIFQSAFDFISKHSYSLFFIHFLYIYFLKSVITSKLFPWWAVCVGIGIISIITQLVIIGLVRIVQPIVSRR